MEKEWRKGSVISGYDTLDYRFPEMYRESVPVATKILIEWFEAFSRRDPEAMARLMLFPFVEVEENNLVRMETKNDFISHPPASLDVSAIGKEAYDLLYSIETRLFRPAEVGFFVNFGRYTPGGGKSMSWETFLTVGRDEEGRWGMQRSSTIMNAADQPDQTYPETLEAARRILHLYMFTFKKEDRELAKEIGVPMEMDYGRFKRMAGSRIGGYDSSIAVNIDIPQHSATKAHCMTTFLRQQADGRPITILRTLYTIVKENGRWRWFIVLAQAREHDFSNDTC
jgi:hypothetical protein